MFKKIVDLDKLDNKTTHIVITFLFFLLHLFVALNHEHWMDEAQAWVISRNLSIIELFQILTSDGHPCLWFLFLMPFSKLGFSYYHISFISLTIMSIGVYLFLQYAPFSLLLKTGVLFSSIFLFYNPVVCRTYSLCALLVICVSIFYKRRYEHNILFGFLAGLLFQSHVLLFGLGIGIMIDMFIDFIKEKRKTLGAALIMLISFIITIFELKPNKYHHPGTSASLSTIINNLNFLKIGSGLKRFALTTWGWTSESTVWIPYVLLIILIVLIFVIITKEKSWKKNYRIILTAICSLGVFFGVVLLVYSPHAQMASIFTMIMLFVMWQLYDINNNSVNMRKAVFCILALISFLSFIPAQSELRRDLRSNYSYSKEAALSILEEAGEDEIVMMENQTFNSSVYSYVVSEKPNIYFYDLYNNNEYVFCEYGIPYKDIAISEIFETIDKNNYDRSKVILLMNKIIDSNELQLIYTNEDKPDSWGEKYYIYKIKN